jgi:hypothetical protein
VTDSTSNILQAIDYLPYGSTGINSGTDVSLRKYIGQFTDPANIDYFNAQYFVATQGQFLSQDPSFLAIGDPNKLKQVTGLDQRTFLADPQLSTVPRMDATIR